MHADEAQVSDQPKIRVVIRKRPLNKKELARNETDVVEVANRQEITVSEQKVKVDLTRFVDQHSFKFDYALDESATNTKMYDECVRPIVQCAFLGAKVTCFAYGQTGSGKTYTMNGDIENGCPGMYYLGAEDIFKQRDSRYTNLELTVSFYEIYCGKLFDLLNNREQLQAREDAKQNVNIIGLTVKPIGNIQEFMQTIAHGSSFRITSQNSTNADSSRSHAILQIELKMGRKCVGKISFIDLAGCQRGADTLDQNKQTKIDGAEINKSLLALKECIRALDLGKNHTPFRGSKLTMVLKDSFTGFCKTLMIGNISPGSGSCENTLNTLRYADRVKELKKGGNPNIEMTKEDRLAKELMLPRNLKNKVTIFEHNSDEEEDRPPNAIVKQATMANALGRNNSKLGGNTLVLQKETKKPKYILKEDEKAKQNKIPSLPPSHNTLASRLGNHQDDFQHSKTRNSSEIPRTKSVLTRPMKPSAESSLQPKIIQNNSFIIKNANPLQSDRVFLKNNSMIGLNLQSREIKQVASKKQEPESILNGQDYHEWTQILEQFKQWVPSMSTFVEMSLLFEELVKFVMREELEVAELHKKILQKEDRVQKQLLDLYNETTSDSKNNEEMEDYASRLSKHLQTRIMSLGQLKKKTDQYKFHLKEHQFCENKLMEAGDLISQSLDGKNNYGYEPSVWDHSRPGKVGYS